MKKLLAMSDSDSHDRKKAKKQRKKAKKLKKKAKKERKRQKKATGEVSSEEEAVQPTVLRLGAQVSTKEAAQALVSSLFLFLFLAHVLLPGRH